MNEMTGGCQCGAVRFSCEIDPVSAHLCHCRMCQKAFGGLFAPLVGVRAGTLVWTRAEPKRFRSSSIAVRGFCPECGTPLTYEAEDGTALAIGAFDDPAPIPPRVQYGIEGRLPCFDELHTLEGSRTMDDGAMAERTADMVVFQHPDASDADEALAKPR